MRDNRKAYTDLSQSKKLAEILPLESADQTWERIAIAGANLNVPEEIQYRHNGDMLFKYYSGIGTPCWSLAALFGILPKFIGDYGKCLYYDVDGYYCGYMDDGNFMLTIQETKADDPVDACVEMIVKLHKLKML